MSIIPGALSSLGSKIGGFLGLGGQPQPDAQPTDETDAQPNEGQAEEPKLSTQLKFSDAEKHALALKIEQDYQESLDAYAELRDRRAREHADLRRKIGQEGGESGKSNFRPPISNALLMSKHAREDEALGGAATVEATPRSPIDGKISSRVGLAMTWQFQENMRARKPLGLGLLKRLQHGRSVVFVRWRKEFYQMTTLARDEIGQVIQGKNGPKRETKDVLWREGPDMTILEPDDCIWPPTAQGSDTIQTIEYFGRRYRTSPTEMLLMESEPGGELNEHGDWYQGIRDNWENIVKYARYRPLRDSDRDYTKIESDKMEGANRDWATSAARNQIGQIEVVEMHMKWRRWREEEEEEDENVSGGMDGDSSSSAMGSSGRDTGRDRDEATPEEEPADTGKSEGDEYRAAGNEAESLAEPGQDVGTVYDDGTFMDVDGHRKDMVETQLIVRKMIDISGPESIIGIQDASEVYPETPTKRPFVSLCFTNSGEFHGPSFIELVEEIEYEITKLINQITDATDFAIKPPIAADPVVGQNLADAKYEPGMIIWTTNPQGVKQLDSRADFSFFAQLLLFYQQLYEQLTGISQIAMGRGLDAPNAPRTLGGQRLIMGAGDVRNALDLRNMNEDLRPLLCLVWDYWRMFGSKQQFYRVAEGDSQDLFEHGDLEGGFAELTDVERQAYYDFELNFADDAQVKEGKKQEMMGFGQFLMALPVFQMNPVAQYRFAKKFGDLIGVDVTDLMPEPPMMPQALTPEQAWNKLLRGEEVHPHQDEDDAAHIQFLSKAYMDMWHGKPEDQDHDAMDKAITLIQEHKQAIETKQQMAVQQAKQGLAALAGAVGEASGHPDPQAAIAEAMQGGQPGQPGGM